MRAWMVLVGVSALAVGCGRREPEPAAAAVGIGQRALRSSPSVPERRDVASALTPAPGPSDVWSAARTAVVRPEVARQVEEEGRAAVLVLLRDPVALTAPLAHRTAAVARVQQEVLDSLPPSRFRLGRRYQAVPALSGEVDAVGLSLLATAPGVLSIDPDLPTHATLRESIPALHADLVHAQLKLTGKGVTVAVLDTGADLNHRDIGPAVVAQHCFTQSACPPNATVEGTSAQDDDGHGTHVAGIITSDGIASPAGFAPDATIVAVKVLKNDGTGQESDWVAGLDWIIANNATLKVQVVNLSLGISFEFPSTCDLVFGPAASAVNQLTAAGVPVFAASGNDAFSNGIAAPACLANAIAVGATYDSNLGREPDVGNYTVGCFDAATSLDTVACFSNSASKVAMLAPGSRITASYLGGGVATLGGTSMATPTAAAIGALLKQVDASLTPSAIVGILQASGPLVTDPRNNLRIPRIDALAAVQGAIAGFCLGKPDGTACDDDDACTRTDTCRAGACVGGNPVVCAALDQCHVAGVCDVATGRCSTPTAADGTACSDGNACTRTDTCRAGACVGGAPVACAALDQCHSAGVCDPQSGQCTNPTMANGTNCNDGNACTRSDTCQAGTCVGGSPVECNAIDACHAAGTCDPLTGQCSSPPRADGTPCNDRNACTTSDSCQAGICVGGSAVACAPPDACHLPGQCDPETGECSRPLAPDGSLCDDKNACTTGDRCTTGACAGTPITCQPLDECHAAGACDRATGQCSQPPLDDGTACRGGECRAGRCQSVPVPASRGCSCAVGARGQPPAVPAVALLLLVGFRLRRRRPAL